MDRRGDRDARRGGRSLGLLTPPALAHWQTPTTGASLLLTVATQSLAVLSAALAVRTRANWLEFAALAPFALGLGSYVLVISRFDRSRLRFGRGDHWITGGALAISALAAGNIAAGANSLAVLGHGHEALRVISGGLWAGSMVWLPALVLAEVLHPRLGYDVRRWSTVFPVGMYAACSILVGRLADAEAITSFGLVWVWVAVVLWAAVFAAMIASKSVRTRTN
jgi:tellurite resistance protein TehA-like permease